MSDLTVPTTETPTSATYALLIGVDDYKALDGTTDANDLKGSRNDVLLLARYCLTVLRMPIENIRMLTSPKFDDKELNELIEALQGEVRLDLVQLQNARGGALESDVTLGVGWLLENTKDADTALLSFSGHGSWSNTLGPVLCLADTERDPTTGEVVNGVLPLGDLKRRIERADARSRVIALLDCCHVTGPATHRRFQTTGIPNTVTAKDMEDDDQDFNVSDRVLLAAQPGQLAHQMLLGMNWHGALTFALVTTAERWLATNGASHGSYEHVWPRANQVVTALEVPQAPMIKVPTERLMEIWKEPFLGVKAGYTVETPDAVGMSTQLPSDWLFTIRLGTDANSSVLAQILTMERTQTATISQRGQITVPPIGGSSEQWFISPTALATLVLSPTRQSLFITSTQPSVANGALVVPLDEVAVFAFGGPGGAGGRPATFGVSTYRAVEDTSWITGQPVPLPVRTTSYYYQALTTNPLMTVEVVVSAQDPTLLVAVRWYQTYDSVPNPPPTSIQPGPRSGLAYTSISPLTPTNLVYSAVSTLIRQ